MKLEAPSRRGRALRLRAAEECLKAWATTMALLAEADSKTQTRILVKKKDCIIHLSQGKGKGTVKSSGVSRKGLKVMQKSQKPKTGSSRTQKQSFILPSRTVEKKSRSWGKNQGHRESAGGPATN